MRPCTRTLFLSVKVEREHFLAAKRVVDRTEADPDAAARAGSATQEAV
jgi:hypothetical protein